MTTVDVLDALACGRCAACAVTVRRGHGVVHCPAHPDERPSLSIDTRGRRTLFHCWAGCSQRDVVDALRDLGLWWSR